MQTPGIHHVTGITGDPQKNIDFYTRTLGLRLVKLTVNFDDPRAYHLYYGNESGEPGTALTFFAWPNVGSGRLGTGEVTSVSFAIPSSSLSFWKETLAEKGATFEELEQFGEARLRFFDPDGLSLELVAEKPLGKIRPWTSDAFPETYAIRGFHAVTLAEDGSERTRSFLTTHFGYAEEDRDDMTFRYKTTGDSARTLYVRVAPDLARGQMGAGTVHHVAFRAKSDADEKNMRDEMLSIGMDATPVIERTYFRSVYFREPGGVLFEIATDRPGFTVDEPLASLGSSLRLPPQFEHYRGSIERALPPLILPHA